MIIFIDKYIIYIYSGLSSLLYFLFYFLSVYGKCLHYNKTPKCDVISYPLNPYAGLFLLLLTYTEDDTNCLASNYFLRQNFHATHWPTPVTWQTGHVTCVGQWDASKFCSRERGDMTRHEDIATFLLNRLWADSVKNYTNISMHQKVYL